MNVKLSLADESLKAFPGTAWERDESFCRVRFTHH